MSRNLLLPKRLCSVLTMFLASAGLASAHAAATHHRHGLSLAPAGLMAAIAKTQAKKAAMDPAYRIADNGCASLKTGPKGRALKGCFAKTGERFASGKHAVSLHLIAWGRAHHLQRVSLRRTFPNANRIEYRGKHIIEWWRVLPMGYEQGFTLDRAPAGHGEVVLQLQANRAPKPAHGTLTWGALHYGKLRVIDATGKVLASHLSARGKTITLAFNARHTQYPVRIDPTVWLRQTLIGPGSNISNDSFGFSVALDSTGTTALVGDTKVGAAYIYLRKSGSWMLAATLTGPSGSGDFGYSVALNSTGTTALVGAWCTPYNSATASCGGSGAAYIYAQSSGSWASTSTPTATFTDTGSSEFGWSVALDSAGTTALVGAPDTNSHVGAAYVYNEPTSGGWVSATTPTATLNSPSTGSDQFGISVAFDGTGNTALIGAWGANGNAGAAYIYNEPSSGGWATTATPTATLTAAGSVGSGWSVALDAAGTTALVGAWSTNNSVGTAYIYNEPTSGGWATSTTPAATLTATGSGQFGWSVALNSTGSTALVAAPNTITSAAYLYNEPTSGGWVTTATPTDTLSAGSLLTFSSVALDSSGSTALVGDGGGEAFAFTPSNLSAVLNAPSSVGTSTQYGADYIVTNNASTASSDVQVQMPVPSGATYVVASATPAGSCGYNSTTQVATCDLGSIAGGAMSTAVLTLQAGATAGTITQTASLVNGAPNLAQTANTSIVSSSTSSSGGTGGLPPGVAGSSGGGGAFGPWTLLGLLGLTVAGMETRRKSIGRR